MKTLSYYLYRMIKYLVRLFYPKIQVAGAENLPPEPALIVSNHAQMNGPIACELYFPGRRYTWCAGQMMHMADVPDYAYQDFWCHKRPAIRWFYRLLSYIIAPISVCVFQNADTIAVYRDSRVLSTFKTTVKRLSEGANVVVFPEKAEKYNHIINQFQDKFIDIARLYYKKTGQSLPFVPMYIAPKLKKMCIGKPIRFDPAAPVDAERDRIRAELMAQITELAESLPLHTVIPYDNISKKAYPTNKIEVSQ